MHAEFRAIVTQQNTLVTHAHSKLVKEAVLTSHFSSSNHFSASGSIRLCCTDTEGADGAVH